ncbi:MAG: hypothetical protein ACPGSM_04430 [Thiolinea sp.]
MSVNGYQRVKFLLGRAFFVLSIVLFSSAVGADVNASAEVAKPVEEEGVVKLVATLQDSPAFTDVVWKLYSLDLPDAPVLIIPRHTAIVNLQPGNYRAVALLKSIVRSRLFNLESRGVEEIILSMDKP